MENFNRKPILAFDCSTDNASVALRMGSLCSTREISHGKHAALLVPTIRELLAEANIALTEVAAIVTPLGPGSFTGLRIALATAHGLHLASGVPLKCPTTLSALAYGYCSQHADAERVTAYLNVGKGDAACQTFTRSTTLPVADGDFSITMITSLPAYLAGKHAIGNIAVEGAHDVHGISAVHLSAMAEFLAPTPAGDALPLYVRPPDAKIPTPPAWLAS